MPAWAVANCSNGPTARGIPKIIIFKTWRTIGWATLYMPQLVSANFTKESHPRSLTLGRSMQSGLPHPQIHLLPIPKSSTATPASVVPREGDDVIPPTAAENLDWSSAFPLTRAMAMAAVDLCALDANSTCKLRSGKQLIS